MARFVPQELILISSGTLSRQFSFPRATPPGGHRWPCNVRRFGDAVLVGDSLSRRSPGPLHFLAGLQRDYVSSHGPGRIRLAAFAPGEISALFRPESSYRAVPDNPPAPFSLFCPVAFLGTPGTSFSTGYRSVS